MIVIENPIVSDDFLEEIKKIQCSHVCYRIFAYTNSADSGKERIPVHRICGDDPDGILTIGRGTLQRLRSLRRSLLKKPSNHTFGLKYSPLDVAQKNKLGTAGMLFLEYTCCNDENESKQYESDAQEDYRQQFGENPPYAGRWEYVSPKN